MKQKNVAILGASNKPDRYSYMAFKMLVERGYKVFPVNPVLKLIDEIVVYPGLLDIQENIDIITIYMRPERWEHHIKEIIEKKPERVIFNPGTESLELEQSIRSAGIECIEACTLVLLRTRRF